MKSRHLVAPNALHTVFHWPLRKALRDKRAALDDDSEDDDPAESSALKDLKAEGDRQAKPIDIPVDETGDEEETIALSNEKRLRGCVSCSRFFHDWLTASVS
jgi:hypothetical protein